MSPISITNPRNQTMQPTIDSDYTYTGLQVGQPVKRVGVRAQSDSPTYGAGARITLNFPQAWADFRQSYLTIDALATQATGTFIAFSYPIQTIFSQVQIKLGGEVVEFIDNFQVLQGIFKIASDLNAVTNVFLEGSSVAATRNTESAGRTYYCHLNLESLQRVIPLHKINQPLQIMLQVAPSSTFIETDGTITSMQFSNVYWNYAQIDGTADQATALQSAINGGTCLIPFHSYENYNTSAASATQQSMSVPVRKHNVDHILVAGRLQTAVNDLTRLDKFTNSFGLTNNPIVHYAKVNNQPTPSDFFQQNGLGLGYYQNLIAFNSVMERMFYAHERQQSCYGAAAWASRQILAYDLRQDSSPKANNRWGNGVNTADSSNSAIVNITYAGASGAAVYDVFSCYEAYIQVKPGMSATVQS